MILPRIHLVTFAAGIVAWSTVATVATAQAEEPAPTLSNNEGLFIDGQSFTLTQRLPKDDVAPQIRRLGARELGPGTIIFRSGNKLYIVDYSDARARMIVSGARPGKTRRAKRSALAPTRRPGLACVTTRSTARHLGRTCATTRSPARRSVRLRDDEINRQALGSRLRDDDIDRQALGSRLRDDQDQSRGTRVALAR